MGGNSLDTEPLPTLSPFSVIENLRQALRDCLTQKRQLRQRVRELSQQLREAELQRDRYRVEIELRRIKG